MIVVVYKPILSLHCTIIFFKQIVFGITFQSEFCMKLQQMVINNKRLRISKQNFKNIFVKLETASRLDVSIKYVQ